MKLIEARKARKVTRERLAIDMGVTVSTIANYEAGRTVPDVMLARKIAEYLGVPEPEIEWGKPSDIDEGKGAPADAA